MNHDEILQAAKEAGYGTAFYLNDDKPAHEEIWGGPMETQKVRSLIKIIEKRTIERCAVVCEMLRDLQMYAAKQEAQNDCATAIRKLGEQ